MSVPAAEDKIGDDDLLNPHTMAASVNAAMVVLMNNSFDAKEGMRYIDLLDELCRGLQDPDPRVAREAAIAAVVSVMMRGPEGSGMHKLRPLLATLARIRLKKAIYIHHEIIELPPVVHDIALRLLRRLPEPALRPQLGVRVLVEIGDSKQLAGDFRQYKKLNEMVPFIFSPPAEMLENALNEEFPWAPGVTASIANEIRLGEYCGRRQFKMRPTLLVGEAGNGKSRYCRRLAEIASVPIRILSIAGASDSMALRGTSAGWSSARPSVVVQFIRSTMVANPLIQVEEVDKTDSRNKTNGSPLDTLLTMLEPETSRAWFDEALEASVDLSHVNFICTSNTLSTLPKPLLDRLQIIFFPAPRKEHYPGLIDSILRGIAAEFKLSDARLLPEIEADERDHLVGNCENVRQLAHAVRRLIQAKVREPGAGRRGPAN